MKTDINTKNYYLSSFQEILGMTLKMNYDASISVINLPEVCRKINPSSIRNILSPIELLLENEKLQDLSSVDKIFANKMLITKYIYNLIDPQADIQNLDNFVEQMQSLSERTYEQNSNQMGFIVFKNPVDDIQIELSKLNIDYIPFDIAINIEEVSNNKESLKLIDSLSLCYVTNDMYQIVGLAKKRKSNQSISTIMSNRYQKDDESILKLYMYGYFINKNIPNRFSEELEKLEKKSIVLEGEINELEYLINEAEKKYSYYKKNMLDSPEFIAVENELAQLLIKQTNLLKEISKIRESQIEILTSEVAIKKMHKKGLTKFNQGKKLHANKNIQFIQFNSGRIEWFINDSLICVLSNGKWKVQNYELIFHIILEYTLRQYIENNDISNEKFIDTVDKVIPRSKILFDNIKELSNKNIGALLIILEQSKNQKKTIYKELLSKKELGKSNYKRIIKTEKLNSINIFSCDRYLFELICSVDGAVLLDKYYNILSFGEMINNSIETPPVAEAGSRTLAAAKASRFGLSIKVSEDGDISLFEDGSPIIKL